MATVLGGNQVKLQNGQTVTAQQGGWYDGQQYWGGSLSAPGVINSQSDQVGAGQAVSSAVNRQSDTAQGLQQGTIDAYLGHQRANGAQASGSPANLSANGTPVGDTSSFNDSTSMTDTSGGSTGAMGMNGVAPSLNLPDLYKTLTTNSGITDLEQSLNDKQKAFNDAQSKINDNPFLSEANRVGRIQKLTTDYNNDVKATQDALAMKKADVQTQLDLQTKQFDINSQAAKQSLDEFNTLLNSGALTNASGADIAAITRATGIGSSLIQSAIKAQQGKDVKTQVITSTDDNGNVTTSVINTQTGEVIAQNNLGAIGGTKTKGSAKAPTVGELLPQMQQAFLTSKDANGNPAVNSYGDVDPQVWRSLEAQWVGAGGTTEDFIKNFSQYTDINRADFESAYGFKKSQITDVKPDPYANQ